MMYFLQAFEVCLYSMYMDYCYIYKHYQNPCKLSLIYISNFALCDADFLK